MPRFVIRKVDSLDVLTLKAVESMHAQLFPESTWDGARVPANSELWVAFDVSGAKPREAAFACMRPALSTPLGGHLYSAGVLPRYRGHGLQKRLIRKRIAAARARGWTCLVTETIYDNCPSANSLIACGFRQFKPERAWSNYRYTVYWRRVL
jgi:GNAT superfamily N-acetyltransferase